MWNKDSQCFTYFCRGGVRQKAGTLPQKDTSVKLKIRQHDCASVPIIGNVPSRSRVSHLISVCAMSWSNVHQVMMNDNHILTFSEGFLRLLRPYTAVSSSALFLWGHMRDSCLYQKWNFIASLKLVSQRLQPSSPIRWLSIYFLIRRDQIYDVLTVPYFNAPVPACTTKRYNNRYGHLYNLEPMQEVEESEALSSSNSTSRLPRGNPCLESLSSEVVERESSANYESFSEGQRAGEITSTSECNEARVTHSSEPRLSVKVSKNHCEKNPPPARPNTPQRRSASQPTTPRNRSEIQVALQVCVKTPVFPDYLS